MKGNCMVIAIMIHYIENSTEVQHLGVNILFTNLKQHLSNFAHSTLVRYLIYSSWEEVKVPLYQTNKLTNKQTTKIAYQQYCIHTLLNLVFVSSSFSKNLFHFQSKPCYQGLLSQHGKL